MNCDRWRLTESTALFYDGWELNAEADAQTGEVTVVYLHGANTDEIIARADVFNANAPNAVVYYTYDHLGSVRALSNASGNIVESYQYEAFGKPTIFDASGNVIARSAFGNRFMFTGREYLGTIQLYDYRNRTYSPKWGRFIEVDPIRFEGRDLNLYRYVENRADIWTDPEGLEVTNNTDHTIYVKDEKNSSVHPLPAGKTWPYNQDGFCDPNRPGEVFKTVDGVDATLNEDGSVTLSILGEFFSMIESIMPDSIKSAIENLLNRKFDNSGWYGPEYINENPDWENLFQSSFYDEENQMCIDPKCAK